MHYRLRLTYSCLYSQFHHLKMKRLTFTQKNEKRILLIIHYSYLFDSPNSSRLHRSFVTVRHFLQVPDEFKDFALAEVRCQVIILPCVCIHLFSLVCVHLFSFACAFIYSHLRDIHLSVILRMQPPRLEYRSTHFSAENLWLRWNCLQILNRSVSWVFTMVFIIMSCSQM